MPQYMIWKVADVSDQIGRKIARSPPPERDHRHRHARQPPIALLQPRPKAERPHAWFSSSILVGERVAAGVAEHVRVRLQLKAGGTRCPLDHPGEAGRRNGDPRSLTKTKTKTNGDVSLSRCIRRKARSSSPRMGWVLGVPFLTRRTCSTAALNSTWSQRRSQSSAARSPCRKARRIIVASRCPWRFALAASTRASTCRAHWCSPSGNVITSPVVGFVYLTQIPSPPSTSLTSQPGSIGTHVPSSAVPG
jgi:hypothetical protein